MTRRSVPSHAHGKTPKYIQIENTYSYRQHAHANIYHTLVETRGGGGLQKTDTELTWQHRVLA